MEKQGWEIYGRMAGARVWARAGKARPEEIFPPPHRIFGRNAMSPSAVSSAYQGLGNGAGLVSSGRNLYPLSPLQFLATSPQKLMCHHINAHETLMKRCTGNSLTALTSVTQFLAGHVVAMDTASMTQFRTSGTAKKYTPKLE